MLVLKRCTGHRYDNRAIRARGGRCSGPKIHLTIHRAGVDAAYWIAGVELVPRARADGVRPPCVLRRRNITHGPPRP
jgi:hypothetical protein